MYFDVRIIGFLTFGVLYLFQRNRWQKQNIRGL